MCGDDEGDEDDDSTAVICASVWPCVVAWYQSACLIVIFDSDSRNSKVTFSVGPQTTNAFSY